MVVAAVGNEGPKKKKACKNCSCGLADELDAEADKAQQQQPSSSCGNVCNFNVLIHLSSGGILHFTYLAPPGA